MNNQQATVALGSTTKVIKKLDPQAPGARRWAATYGENLVCVRYRVDPERQRRLTTVEFVVDEAPTLSSVRVGVRVAWGEKELARSVRAVGGIWKILIWPSKSTVIPKNT